MSSPIYRSDDGDDDEPLRPAPPWLSTRRQVVQTSKEPDLPLSTFSGDRALVELNRQLARRADLVPEPPLEADEYAGESQRPMMWRFFSLAGIAAVIAWGIVLLPSLRKTGPETSQTHVREAATEVTPAAQISRPPSDHPTAVATIRIPAARPAEDPPGFSSDPSATTRSPAAVGKPVATASPQAGSLARVASAGSATAATPAAAAVPPTTQFSPVTAAQAATVGSPSPQSGPAAAAPIVATTSPSSTSPQPPVSPQANTSTPATPGSVSIQNSDTSTLDRSEIGMLLGRGQDFLSTGDLSSARLLFQRAAEGGSAEAALALASTYDPRYLATHNVIGVVGDEEKARAWYQRAADLGSPEAVRMLSQLGAK
jgi:hypothetical protein